MFRNLREISRILETRLEEIKSRPIHTNKTSQFTTGVLGFWGFGVLGFIV